MKYITRKPLEWFGPFHLLDPLEKLLIKMGKTEDEAYAVVEKLADRIPSKPFQLLYQFREKLPWNKTVIRIDKWDTWSMDDTLAHIILPMLKQLKATKHGIPCEFAEVGGESWKDQLCFDFYQEDTADLFEEHAERRWNEVMDKMIWSFEQAVEKNTNPDAYWQPYWEDMTPEEVVEETENSIYKQLDIDHPRKKINREKMSEYYDRMQEGFTLFGKYYCSLWD